MTRKNCRQFKLLTWTSLIRQFVHSVNEGRGFGKGGEFEYRYLASCTHHFIREHENSIQHPSNNISIDTLVFGPVHPHLLLTINDAHLTL